MVSLPVIGPEVLEAEDVKDADGVALVVSKSVFLGQQSVIDLQYDPVEQGSVQALCHGVTRCYSLEVMDIDQQQLTTT